MLKNHFERSRTKCFLVLFYMKNQNLQIRWSRFFFNLWKCGWIQNRLTWKRAVFFWYLLPVSFLIVISLRTQGTGHLHRKSIASSLWKFPKIWRIFAKPYSIFSLAFVFFLPSRATNFLGCSSVNFCKWSYWQSSNSLFEVSLLYVHSMLSTI